MSQVTISVPDHLLVALNESDAEFARDLKLEYAKHLVKEGRLTFSQAAELAEISVAEMLFRLSADGIPVIDYPADELEEEIRALS